MRNLRPIGIPHSIFLENLFARTYDASKLEEDTERVRRALQDRGYFRAGVNDPSPISGMKAASRSLPFALARVSASTSAYRSKRGAIPPWRCHLHRQPACAKRQGATRPVPTKDGELFNATAVGKGLDNLRKAYGSLGYINFTAVPTPRIDDAKHLVFLDIDIDEGKPFYVSRIEFSGNTITRDRVIRRELLLEEARYITATFGNRACCT